MSRRISRETALQVLYQVDITGETDIEGAIENWAVEFSIPKKSLEYTLKLVKGSLQYKNEIDEKIGITAHEWAVDRMNNVDRNLMRLAVYEMLYCQETPQRVTVNEAIEIAKKFGGEDSAKFINGILDKFMDAAEKV